MSGAVKPYMPNEFYIRLKKYYTKVGEVLRGEADIASIFPNPTDIGMSRERVYAEFLRSHLPSCCNVLYGGPIPVPVITFVVRIMIGNLSHV